MLDIKDNSQDQTWRGRLFWKLQLAGWGALGFLGVFFVGIGYFPPREALIISSFRAVFGFAVTSALRLLYRRMRCQRGNLWLKSAGVFFVCGLVAIVDSATAYLLIAPFGQRLEEEAVRQFFIGSTFMRWMLYWLWSVLYFGVNYWFDTQASRLRQAEAETEARVGELRMLRAQVNPHFLFNALNSIQAVADEPGLVRSLTQSLAEYLRFSLEQRENTQALGIELDALENYLSVEKIRFEEKLEYRIEADAAARETFAPVALVQPLLENAIKYGQRTSTPPLRLGVRASLVDGALEVTVRNSGSWIQNGGTGSTGTGLANLRRRLDLLYGEKASLSTGSENGEVSVFVRLPIESGKA